jgi:Protein of unknown function (DUF2628)
MAAYSVFEPPPRSGEPGADPERFRFVRDGFSWGAFLLGPLWMLWCRLWLVFAGYIVLMAVIPFGLAKLGASPDMIAFVAFLIALLLGFEGSSLARWTLRRRRWRELGIVVGQNREEAERRFFDVWVAHAAAGKEPPPVPPGALRPAGRSYASDIVGLFPEPGGSR